MQRRLLLRAPRRDRVPRPGGERCSGPLIEDGGPGLTSGMELFYAERPADVLAAAVEEVAKRLA